MSFLPAMRKIANVALLLSATTTGCQGAPLNAGYNLPDEVDGGGLCVPGATAPCYTGPAATEGVGLCTRGTATCNGDGMSFGPCQGDTTPQPEDCATPVDEDCDGLAPQCTGGALWSKRFGDTNRQAGGSIATDTAGSVLVTGLLFGSADFGGGPLVSAGSADVFVAKFDGGGAHLWSRRFGDDSHQESLSIAVDASANVLIAGQFSGVLDFGGSPLASAAGATFVAKLDPNGEHLWSKQFANQALTFQPPAIAFDPSGNVLILGSLQGMMDIDGNTLVSAGGTDVFLAKFDAASNHLWSKRFGDAAEQLSSDIAVDAVGNIAITGSFEGTLDFGESPLVSTGSADIFLAKLDAAGNSFWSKHFVSVFGSPMGTRLPVAADDVGNIILSGPFAGDIDFGGAVLSSKGYTDIFLAKLNGAGNHIYSKRFGDADNQQVRDVAVDGSGNVVLTGFFFGTLGFGGGQLASAGGSDGFVAKLGAGGDHLWSVRFGDVINDDGHGVATDINGNNLLTGEFTGTVDFGNGPLVSEGSQAPPPPPAPDIFVAKFSP